MNADGTGQRQVRPILGVDPSWSPDDRIAFSGMRVMHEDGSGLRRLTPKGGFEPAWSPDGSSIAFVRQVAKAETSYEIFTMRATGGDERRLTKNRVTDFSPAWSPDGRRLAVERGAYVWVLNADGSDPRRLARGSSPTWSPDGSAIAFVRDFTLWVMEADGRRQRRISPEPGRPRLSSGAHSAPAWSP
jgi:TolB protein